MHNSVSELNESCDKNDGNNAAITNQKRALPGTLVFALKGQDNVVYLILGHKQSAVIPGPLALDIIPCESVSNEREPVQCCDLVPIHAT